MENTPNPLLQQYENMRKLDYFILTADIAILGWLIANTNWVPKNNTIIFIFAIALSFISISIIFGIIRQLYISTAFGLNHLSLHHGEMANVIERASFSSGLFTNQQSGKEITNEEFKKFAPPHRKTEKETMSLYEKYSERSAMFGNLTIIFLAIGLFSLLFIKIMSMYE